MQERVVVSQFIKGLDKSITAEAVIDTIINDIRDFSGGTQQNGDMTVVVSEHYEICHFAEIPKGK